MSSIEWKYEGPGWFELPLLSESSEEDKPQPTIETLRSLATASGGESWKARVGDIELWANSYEHEDGESWSCGFKRGGVGALIEESPTTKERAFEIAEKMAGLR